MRFHPTPRLLSTSEKKNMHYSDIILRNERQRSVHRQVFDRVLARALTQNPKSRKMFRSARGAKTATQKSLLQPKTLAPSRGIMGSMLKTARNVLTLNPMKPRS